MVKTWDSRFRDNTYIYIRIIAFLAFLPSEPARANLHIVKFAHASARFLFFRNYGFSRKRYYSNVSSRFPSARDDAKVQNDTFFDLRKCVILTLLPPDGDA